MTTNPRREPSLDLQRQIDDSIAARKRSNISSIPTLISSSPSTETDAAGKTNVEPGVPPDGAQFEYLNHPADIILHSWGEDLPQALSNLALCMFGYITSLDSIEINEAQSSGHGKDITGQGHDLHSLIYSFLDEWLFNFHDSGFVPKEVDVSEFSGDVWRIVSSGNGELMDISRHPQGTEIKAITYSGMRVDERKGRCDVFVVVDI
mmetsp:Transcript_301/g.596  ORF Transcript_301/g.596 Transcript_301/m.596 type:complete len:206 (-) Transcript_301:30-647(-)